MLPGLNQPPTQTFKGVSLTLADDDQYSAMSGLLGEPIGSIKTPMARAEFSRTPLSVDVYLKGSAAQECFIDTSRGCVFDYDMPSWNHGCGPGMIGVGVAHGTNVPHKSVCKVSESGF